MVLLASVLVSGGLLLTRRRFGQRLKDQEYINTSIFSFFSTLYAFFIGFAIVTLWSTFLSAKADVNHEADAIISAYYSSQNLPNSEAFRQSSEKLCQNGNRRGMATNGKRLHERGGQSSFR